MPDAAAAGPFWTDYVLVVLLALTVLLLVALILNVIRMRHRVGIVVRQLRDASESGPGAQMEEAVAQLQGASVSLDRIAARCDELDSKLTSIVQRGPGGEGGALAETLSGLGEEFARMREPLEEIRDNFRRAEVDRIGDEVRRTLFNMGFDRVDITTDLNSLQSGEGKVQVEVQREGVKSKGYLVLKNWTVIEQKISPTYEMFP